MDSYTFVPKPKTTLWMTQIRKTRSLNELPNLLNLNVSLSTLKNETSSLEYEDLTSLNVTVSSTMVIKTPKDFLDKGELQDSWNKQKNIVQVYRGIIPYPNNESNCLPNARDSQLRSPNYFNNVDEDSFRHGVSRHRRYSGRSPIIHQPKHKSITQFSGLHIRGSSTSSEGLSELKALNSLDRVFLKQACTYLEALTGSENKYQMSDKDGNLLFLASESSSTLMRTMFGTCRAFRISLCDISGSQVVHFEHPGSCIFSKILVKTTTNTLIGSVNKACACIRMKYKVKDAANNVLFVIREPFVFLPCVDDNYDFDIFNANEPNQRVGWITRLRRDPLDVGDDYWINFPPQSSVSTKALIISAAFLFDILIFESYTRRQP